MCLDLSKSGESSDKELNNFGFAVGFVQFHTKGQLIWKANFLVLILTKNPTKLLFDLKTLYHID